MNRRSRWLIFLWLTAVSRLAFGWTSVGPGIEYQEFTLPDPNNLFVARMDRGNPTCIIESSIGQGRLTGGTERVSSQASRNDDALSYWEQDWGRRNDVIVAVNGDFYNTSTGVPASGQIKSGWLAKKFSTGSFTWTMDREAFISSGLNWSQYVVYPASGASQTAHGINRARGTDELIVYTPQYDSDTNTDASGVEVLVEMTRPTLILPVSDPARGFVRQIRQSQGSTPIPFDHVVLSATGTAATTLINNVSLGDEITVSQDDSNVGKWARAHASVGGGEVFLINGVVVGGQYIRHPRTAIAYNDDYVFFVVVDGRSGVSVGMNMVELGTFCKDYLAADYGINQDGGGSSTMVVNGVVKNDPSDGSERYVSNGMMMVALQTKTHSDAFGVNDLVKATARSNVRLGPGTNYAVLTTVAKNAQGLILDHHLRGVYAKGYYWWKCDFSGTVGWIAESLLALVSAGNFPTITQHPADAEDVCTGQNATFNVAAAGTGTLAYRWQHNGINLTDDGHYSGATSSALTISSVDDGDMASYRCTVTDDVGTATSHSAALLPPRPMTIITRHPESQGDPPVTHGIDVDFSVIATGAESLTYSWQKDENDLTDDGHFAGTATAILTIQQVNSNDDGSYRCRVTAGCGTVYSDPALLEVTTPDFDGDGDVDLEDFGHLQECFSGPGNPQTDPDCLDARMDGDSDVDPNDFLLFQQCFAGPDVVVDPTCLD